MVIARAIALGLWLRSLGRCAGLGRRGWMAVGAGVSVAVNMSRGCGWTVSWGWRWRVCVFSGGRGVSKEQRKAQQQLALSRCRTGAGAGVSTKMRQALVQERCPQVCSRHALTSGHRLRLCRRLPTGHAAILEPSHTSFQSPAGPPSSSDASGTNRWHRR